MPATSDRGRNGRLRLYHNYSRVQPDSERSFQLRKKTDPILKRRPMRIRRFFGSATHGRHSGPVLPGRQYIGIFFREGEFIVPIHLNCPNGHHLTAKESNAGKTGKCPVCKVSVTIPVLHQSVISDSAIMTILGDASGVKKTRVGTTVTPGKKKPVVKKVHRTGSDSPSASAVSVPYVKICPSCEREIDMGYHICPFCHTYITGLNDF